MGISFPGRRFFSSTREPSSSDEAPTSGQQDPTHVPIGTRVRQAIDSIKARPLGTRITSPVTAHLRSTGTTGPFQAKEPAEVTRKRFEDQKVVTGKMHLPRRARIRGKFHRQLTELEGKPSLQRMATTPSLCLKSLPIAEPKKATVPDFKKIFESRFPEGGHEQKEWQTQIDALAVKAHTFCSSWEDIQDPRDQLDQGERLALLLRNGCHGDVVLAGKLLEELQDPTSLKSIAENPELKHIKDLAGGLRRAMAQTPSGFKLLIRLEKKEALTPSQQQAYRHCLDISERIAQYGRHELLVGIFFMSSEQYSQLPKTLRASIDLLVRSMRHQHRGLEKLLACRQSDLSDIRKSSQIKLSDKQIAAYESCLNCVVQTVKTDGSNHPVDNPIRHYVEWGKDRPEIHGRIGGNNDAPTKLLYQALMYAKAKMDTPDPNDIPAGIVKKYRAAYALGYCQGDFTSCPGSDFIKKFDMMNKSHKYVARAERNGGERNAKNIMKSFGRSVDLAVTGRGKNPYGKLVENGHMSAMLGSHVQEASKLRDQIGSTTQLLIQGMEGRIAALYALPDAEFTQVELVEALVLYVRKAMVGQMQAQNFRGIRPDMEKILESIPTPLLASNEELVTRILTDELQPTVFHDSKEMRFKTLEKYAQALYKPPEVMVRGIVRHLTKDIEVLGQLEERTPAQQDQLDYATIMVEIAKARYLKNGGKLERKDRMNSFLIEDVWRIAAKKPKRVGVTKEIYYEVDAAMSLKNTDIVSARSGQTWGPNLGYFNASVGGVDSPLFVRPMLKLNWSKHAIARRGDAAAGGERSVGVERATSYGLGGRLGINVKMWHEKLNLGAMGGAEAQGKRSKMEAAVMGSRIDQIGDDSTPAYKKTYMDLSAEFAKFDRVATDREKPLSRKDFIALMDAGDAKKDFDGFGDDGRFNFTYRRGKAHSESLLTHVSLTARAGVSGDVRVGPNIGVNAGVRKEKIREQNAGRFANRMIDADTKVIIGLEATLSAKAKPLFNVGDVTRIGLTGQPLIGISTEWNPWGVRTLTRIVEDENGICPGMTYANRYFVSPYVMGLYLHDRIDKTSNMDRMTSEDYWFNDLQIHSWDTMDPATAEPITGLAAVRQFVMETQHLPANGETRCEERPQFKVSAAQTVNLLKDQIHDLKVAGSDHTLSRIDKKNLWVEQQQHLSLVQRKLKNQDSWDVRWLRAVQTEVIGSSKGIVPILTLTANSRVDSPHKVVAVKGTTSYTIPAVPFTGPRPVGSVRLSAASKVQAELVKKQQTEAAAVEIDSEVAAPATAEPLAVQEDVVTAAPIQT
jgi:hypothetical protein